MGDAAKDAGFPTVGKVITCKAAVAWEAGEPLVVQQVQVQPPQKMEVRIKILYSSICHTDLSALKGENEAQRAYPRILGHEASGMVESVGEGVTDLQEGDHVVPVFNGECGDCAYCKHDQTNLCHKFRVNPFKSTMVNDGKTRFSTLDGKPIFHFLNTSTFSEYTVIDSACVVKVDPDAPLHKMALLSCCVSTGKAVAEGARARGASRIIGVDVNPDKFIKGKLMGITDFLNPKEVEVPIYDKIKELTQGGVDYSFECAGNLDVLRNAFLSTHDGWGLTVVLGIHPSPRLLPLHPMELFDGRKIVATTFGDFKPKTQLPHFAKQCMQGVVNLEEFITHELPFDHINEAFQLLVDGKSLRCLLHL
uniref:Alcohol dehydrogenase n=1 Tax=Kalanchoe fedtschenkoi TaxID=63787 RepID=A0A7N0T7W7_KALFE